MYFDAEFWTDSSHSLGTFVATSRLGLFADYFRYNQFSKLFCANHRIKTFRARVLSAVTTKPVIGD